MREGLMARGAAVLMVGALALGAAACSDDDDADSAAATTTAAIATTPAETTCEAWGDLTDQFANFSELDPLNDGMDSVRAYAETLQESVDQLRASVSAQLTPPVEDLKAAVDDLKESVTGDTIGGGNISASLRAVADGWNGLIAEFQTECPDVTAETVPV